MRWWEINKALSLATVLFYPSYPDYSQKSGGQCGMTWCKYILIEWTSSEIVWGKDKGNARWKRKQLDEHFTL